MARTWLSVTVELLGGRGEEFWPRPGRVFAVGPAHTFLDLADAINETFARWDHAHISLFTTADGRMITDEVTGEEMSGSPYGPVAVPVDIETTKVARTVRPGDEFEFTFDLGDEWIHRCTVGLEKIDPVRELGIRPEVPLPYWGWGTIPDQYGRRWAEDDGTGPEPDEPARPDPMLMHDWPPDDAIPMLSTAELDDAVAAEDADRFLAAVVGHTVDHALEAVAAGIPMALRQRRRAAEPVALSILNRLSARGGPGDQELADGILALLRGTAPDRR